MYAGPILPDILAVIFNFILQSGHIPSAFRHGLIIPISKGHNIDLFNPSNYGGHHTIISKDVEKINTILSLLAEQESILHPLEGGFRQSHHLLYPAIIPLDSGN